MMLDAVLDTTPLRASPAFRRLWLSSAASTFSAQVAVVAVLYQVWELTHSPFWVGAIGLAEGLPMIVFGLLNEQRFGGSPETLGLFLSAIAAGGIVAGLVSGPATRAARPGLVALGAAAVWGLAMIGFGLVDGLPATLACLAVAGAADTVAVLARGIVIQLDTPDSHLGRAGSAEYAVGAGGPAIGNARAGVVAGFTSAELTAVTGGLACAVAVVAIAATHPALRRWTPQAERG